MPKSGIQTYHCLCSHLILATTYNISQLPQRKKEALDRACILPCPPTPEHVKSAILSDTRRSPSPPSADEDVSASLNGITIMLSMPVAPQPLIVRRNDGIEKRYLLRCSRCKLAVGYQLDWAQWQQDGSNAGKKGRRDDLLYVLPGAVVITEQILNGEKVRDEDVGFGLEKG